MTEVKHLSPGAQAALKLPDGQRIERISGARWIGYTRAQDILTKLDDLLTYPRQPRMPNLLLYGVTGNGKTMIINRFITRHPADDHPDGDAAVVPVLAVQAPPLPSEADSTTPFSQRCSLPISRVITCPQSNFRSCASCAGSRRGCWSSTRPITSWWARPTSSAS